MDHPDDDVTWLCGAFGPPPVPGGRGYRCTREHGHEGAHEAEVDGERVDSWPAKNR